MIRPITGTSIGLVLLLGASVAEQLRAQETAPTYNDVTTKVFRSRCFTCHNADNQKGGLNLTTYATLMEGGGSGPVIEPGDAENSWLYLLVAHEETPKMPPNAPRIPDQELEVLRDWIIAGAPESAGSAVTLKKKPKMEFRLDPDAIGRPAGDPAMPGADVSTEPVLINQRPGAILALATSPWAPLVAIGQHQQVLLYDLDQELLVGVLPFPEGDVHVLKFTRDGELLLAGGGRGGQSGRVVVWDIKSGDRVIEVGDEYDLVLGADISPDRTLVALGGPSKVLRVYSTGDNALVYEQRKHTEWVTSVAFSPDGVLLASGDRNGGLFVWEAFTGREFYTLDDHKEMITDLSWRLDSNVLASSSQDTSVKLWDLFKGERIRSFNAHGGGTTSVRFAKDGRLVTSGRDRSVKLWAQDGKEIKTLPRFESFALQAAIADDDTTIVAGSFDGEVRVFSDGDVEASSDLIANPTAIRDRLSLIRERHNAAQLRADQALEELKPLQEALSVAQQRVSRAEEALKAIEAETAPLQKKLGIAQSTLEQATAKLQEARSAYLHASDLDTEALAALATSTTNAVTQAKQLRESVAAGTVVDEAEYNKRTTALQSIVTALAQAIESGSSIHTTSQALAAATQRRRAASTALRSAEVELEEVRARVATARAALDESLAQRDQAVAAVQAREPSANSLATAVEALEDHLDRLQAELEAQEATASTGLEE